MFLRASGRHGALAAASSESRPERRRPQLEPSVRPEDRRRDGVDASPRCRSGRVAALWIPEEHSALVLRLEGSPSRRGRAHARTRGRPDRRRGVDRPDAERPGLVSGAAAELDPDLDVRRHGFPDEGLSHPSPESTRRAVTLRNRRSPSSQKARPRQIRARSSSRPRSVRTRRGSDPQGGAPPSTPCNAPASTTRAGVRRTPSVRLSQAEAASDFLGRSDPGIELGPRGWDGPHARARDRGGGHCVLDRLLEQRVVE